MLFLHETHRVIGRHAADFEALLRDEWMGALARSDTTRLLWYLNHAMGSGPAYEVVTVTGLSPTGLPGRSWVTGCGRATWPTWPSGSTPTVTRWRASSCCPSAWSALQEVDLASRAYRGRHRTTCRCTCRTPDGPTPRWTTTSNSGTRTTGRSCARRRPEKKLLDIQACFQVAHGSGIRPEAILMQKVVNFSTLGRLLTSAEEHDPTTWPGTYMAKGLEIRDQWESKLLRTSAWSPLW